MNLKKLALASAIVLMAGCDEKELDQVLVDQLWTKCVETVKIDPKTSKPEVAMMDEDLYLEILKKDCESEPEAGKKDCLAERKKLEDSVLQKTGKAYNFLYARYIPVDRKIYREDCGKYSDKEKKKQCEADKFSGKSSGVTLGRAFLADNYVEIYFQKIWEILDNYSRYYASHGLTFSSVERICFFYSVLAHEMLHIALTIKKIGANDQHREMRDNYMDPLLNLISDYEKADRKGYQREMAFGSLKVGIDGDEAAKRINDRQNSGNPESKKEILVLPCGLRIY